MEGLDPKKLRADEQDIAALEESIEADGDLSRRITGQN
jgi:hypothetical protein